MEKRYQVFVSSTYADLCDERRYVIQTLMEMDCIPSGMELFPAIDEEQFEFIKKVIDDCDYYLLIIGGRYGSVTSDGISYTKKEYDYAIQHGIKVIAFLHKNPKDIPLGKSDVDPVLSEKLREFRDEVSKGRLVKFWNSAEELPGLVALSLSQTIKRHPAEGWVRANRISSSEILSEINELRKRNTELEKEINILKGQYPRNVEDLALFEDTFKVYGTYTYGIGVSVNGNWEVHVTWKQIFSFIAPHILENPNDNYVKGIIKDSLFKIFSSDIDSSVRRNNQHVNNSTIDDQIYQTIKIQFIALGLINTQYSQTIRGAMALFWLLTAKGRAVMMDVRSVKSKS